MSLLPFVIFTYNTKHLKYSDKVRFYYALKGRDGKTGIINELKIIQLGKTVLLAKQEYEENVKKFLSEWKCEFSALHALMREEEVRQ